MRPVPTGRWKSTISGILSYIISNALRGAVLKSFPAPLSPSEEKYYIQKYTEGDLEAKHILIERNLRLVAHVIKKYQNLEEDPEDLISIGTIGLIKAVVTFNPDKGNRLAAYASRCVENEILMYLRSKKKAGKEVSLYEPIGTDREGNEIRLYDIIETEEDDIPDKIHLKENHGTAGKQHALHRTFDPHYGMGHILRISTSYDHQ